MSTSIIRFHAFSGAQSSDPPCYLLQIDEFHFLLDCGVDEYFNLSGIEEVKKYVKVIDAVLLTHPNPHHLGALPYLVGKCGLNCPVYATTPVYKMGQLFMYDVYQSKHSSEDFAVFTLDDVDAAFDTVVQVKFHQTINLHGKGQGLTITALPAGHMLGGTIWKIMKDDTDIVYAIDYNHKKERHLNGAAFDSCLRPHLLIADAGNALYSQSRRRTRDEQLMKSIMQTLRRGGNVLLAVDTAGRCLEIAHLLEQLWHNQESGLMAYGLALLNHVAYNVIEFAKSQVEWMSDKVMRTFEDQRSNPFNFRHMQLCHAVDQLENVSHPKVVLASQADLQTGFARDIFLKWCDNEKNLVILTQRCSSGTLAQNLYDDANLKNIRVDVGSRVRLVGEELEEYLEKRRLESGATTQEMGYFGDLDNSATGLPGLHSEMSMIDEDEDSSDEELMETSVAAGPARMDSISSFSSVPNPQDHHGKHGPTFDITIGTQPHSGGPWFKAAKKTQLLFPYTEKKRIWDEYGEKVNLSEYIGQTGGSDGTVVTIIHDDKTQKEVVPDVPAPAKVKKTFSETRSVSLASGHGNVPQSLADLLGGEIPSKCVVETKDVAVKCGVYFIDFEGRSDGEAMKKILSSFRPQEIILVRGSPKATNQLAEYCRTNMHLSPDLIHTPCVGDTLDCTKEGFIYQARMKDSLVSSLNFFKIRDYELSWIDADVIIEHNVDSRPVTDQNNDISAPTNETVPVLVPPEGKVHDHATVLVNEPKLSDVKQILINHGMNAEFLSGVLVIDNCVAIKRSEAGKFLLEGTISDTYFNVRRLLYSQFAIL